MGLRAKLIQDSCVNDAGLLEEFISELAGYLLGCSAKAYISDCVCRTMQSNVWVCLRQQGGAAFMLGIPAQTEIDREVFQFSCLARVMAFLSNTGRNEVILPNIELDSGCRTWQVDILASQNSTLLSQWTLCRHSAAKCLDSEKHGRVAYPQRLRAEIGIKLGATTSLQRRYELSRLSWFLRTSEVEWSLKCDGTNQFYVSGENSMSSDRLKLEIMIGSVEIGLEEFSALRPGCRLALEIGAPIEGTLCVNGVAWAAVQLEFGPNANEIRILEMLDLTLRKAELPEMATLAEIFRLDDQTSSNEKDARS
ncbi:MAG: hypothetical protein K1X79_02565 [Oligoflexia bacterium]|nr:hypothetical protein [Oligoflexia bacterium]